MNFIFFNCCVIVHNVFSRESVCAVIAPTDFFYFFSFRIIWKLGNLFLFLYYKQFRKKIEKYMYSIEYLKRKNMKRVSKEIWKELKKVGYNNGFSFILRPKVSSVLEWLHNNGVHISLLYTNISDKWETQIQIKKKASNRVFWVSIPSYTSWNREDYDVTLNNAIINAIDVYKKNFLK